MFKVNPYQIIKINQIYTVKNLNFGIILNFGLNLKL